MLLLFFLPQEHRPTRFQTQGELHYFLGNAISAPHFFLRSSSLRLFFPNALKKIIDIQRWVLSCPEEHQTKYQVLHMPLGLTDKGEN